MSSKSPSTPTTSRNLFDRRKIILYHRIIKNKLLEQLHAPRRLEASVHSSMQRNIMTQYSNIDVSITNPFSKPRTTLCKFSVKEYRLEDLTVKIENGFIVIRGSHNEKKDKYGYVSRKLTRRVPMPMHLLKDDIKVKLLFNGTLLITANNWPEIREIPINKINQTKLELQRNQKEQLRIATQIVAEEQSTKTDSDKIQLIEENKTGNQTSPPLFISIELKENTMRKLRNFLKIGDNTETG